MPNEVHQKNRMRVFGRLFLVVTLLILPPLLPSDRIPLSLALDYQVAALANGRGFTLFLWETQAVASKLTDLIVNPARGLDEEARRRLVLEYVQTARQVASLDAQITRILSGSGQEEGGQSTESIQRAVDELRLAQAQRRPAVEAILEEQVAAMAADEGLTTLGVLWPPVKFQFSDPPLYLIVSPRQTIAVRKGVHLAPDLSLAERTGLEQAADEGLSGFVSLIEDLGGFGTYPTMVLDHASLPWILDTIAHEWAHNYLAFRPLGWHYFDSSDTVTLNETAASIVGEEIGSRILERYYPEQVPPPTILASERRPPLSLEDAPPEFDFSQAMRRTRLRVDELLAEGRVDEAERYMEAQRQVFVAEGYALRKLNQAYFAFHGSYATSPGAVDPIGPKMTQLRQDSASLQVFLETVAAFTRVEDLDQALASS